MYVSHIEFSDTKPFTKFYEYLDVSFKQKNGILAQNNKKYT